MPAFEIIFDHNKYYTLYEASRGTKYFTRMRYPFYIFTLMGSWVSANFLFLEHGKVFLMNLSLMAASMVVLDKFEGMQGSIIKSMRLIANFEDEIVDEVLLENMLGHLEVVKVRSIKSVSLKEAKIIRESQIVPRHSYPVFVDDILMFFDFTGTFQSIDLFRAIINGHKIDLSKVQTYRMNEDESDSEDYDERQQHLVSVD